MSKILVLYDYNNYFNRKIKKFSTYNEYLESQIDSQKPYLEINRTNFDISDGVNAKHVINVASSQPAYTKNPNYLILEDEREEISRWFVLECVRIRGGQYRLSLRRDVVADFYDNIMTSPCFIQKGYLNYTNPLIFNNEGMSFNQIKTKEYLLKDETKSSWVVGYMANAGETEEPIDITAEAETIAREELSYNDLSTQLKNLIGHNVSLNNNVNFDIVYTQFTPSGSRAPYTQYRFRTNVINSKVENTILLERNYSNYNYNLISINEGYAYGRVPQDVNDSFTPGDCINAIVSQLELSSYFPDELRSYIGKIIVKDNKKYTLSIKYVKSNDINIVVNGSNLLNSAVGFSISNFAHSLSTNNPNYGELDRNVPASMTVANVQGTIDEYILSLEPGEFAQVETTISNISNKLHDAPYNIFAIPMSNNLKIRDDNGNYIDVIGNVALSVAREISLKLTSAKCYDIQILPYCPFREALYSSNKEVIDLSGLIENKDYNLIKDSDGNVVNVILYPISSRGSFDIDIDTEELSEFKMAEDEIERKVSSETIIARFVSPNYSGSFEINPQKNDGISTVNVDYNLKPYTPYIHIAPIFKGLYGYEFNDARGLICGGDFSISTASSKWEEYQVQNKNFENIFNRQIDNMDFNNSLNMQKAKFNAAVGTMGAGIGAGVGAGVATGNIGVAVGVGALSTVTSAIGGLMDVEILAKQQTENRAYAVDMYNYQLGNIKALPYTLSKISTFNENNKIFPFIEIYDCTEIEKQNLRDKIKYNGMTVMIQGKIEDYLNPNDETYIQAQLIRLEGIDDDSHLISEIYNELIRGIYL